MYRTLQIAVIILYLHCVISSVTSNIYLWLKILISRHSRGWMDTGTAKKWTKQGNMLYYLFWYFNIFVVKSWLYIIICLIGASPYYVQYSNIKSRFFWYFIYLCDLRNLEKERKLRWLADPRLNIWDIWFIKLGNANFSNANWDSWVWWERLRNWKAVS